MHRYAVLNNKNEKNITIIYMCIFFISALCTMGVNYLIGNLVGFITAKCSSLEIYASIADLLNLIPSISFIPIFFLLKALFDNKLWVLFQCCIGIPNINGTWVGKLSSSYEKDLDMTMKIEQTLNKLKVTCAFDKSTSESCIAALDVQNFLKDGNWKIHFSYDNTSDYGENHIGFNTVEYIQDKNIGRDYLKGKYFTNRNRENSSDKGTYGTFFLANIF